MAVALGYPQQARLRAPADFVALRREGKRFSSRCFYSQYRLTGSGQARLGIAVSRRVSKRALDRNRIRRIIRESFRLCRNDLPACDVLLIARAQAAAQSRGQLRADIALIWNHLAALKRQHATRTIPPRS